MMNTASELQDLETISEHTSPMCTRRDRGRFNPLWQISPALERTKVARDPKPVLPTTTTARPAELPACAPAPLPEITSYDTLILCLRARADELQISREAISEIAGLPERYAAKVLSLSKIRRIGMESLSPILGALSVKLVMVVDEAAYARNKSAYTKRDEPHYRSATAHPKTASDRALADLTRWAKARGLSFCLENDAGSNS